MYVQKAFDKVPCKKLMHRVTVDVNVVNILAWIKNQLTDRKQGGGINESFSGNR